MKSLTTTSSILLSLLPSISTALSACQPNKQCPIIFDGRIAKSFPISSFDTTASPFDPDFVKGQNLTWSEIIKYPNVEPSKFDPPTYRPFEVTISDESIFVAEGKLQPGFRRAGLTLGNGSDASNVGVRIYHWSVRQDSCRPMNLTHEYMNVWHETNDYSANQWSLNTGTMLSQDQPLDSNVTTEGLDKHLWKVLNRNNDVIWTTKIEEDEWQNFGIVMDIPSKYDSHPRLFTGLTNVKVPFKSSTRTAMNHSRQ